ncbi:MAG: DUF2953 domain-containing protein [Firmicutes bacterium]|nr:DUF2953 domain-containing protein [Bacillota bacterium]
MAWWGRLLLSGFALLLSTGIILMLPLRIFVCYLRENKTAQVTLRLELGFIALVREPSERAAAGGSPAWYLAAGRFRVPAAFMQLNGSKRAGLPRAGRLLQRRLPEPPDISDLAGLLALRRQAGPLLKKITWSHFDLAISWGGSDPALTALAAGSCWSALGALAGLLQVYFTVKEPPRIRVEPQFRSAGLQVRWEGEAALSLYRCLRLWQFFKKIGGADSGTSSH